jgi:hypothetical protein
MTLTELVQEVYTITGRPDRVNETSSAIRSATLKAHQSDYYWKDIRELGITFDSAEYIQSLDYRALISNWRAIKYLRKYDLTSGLPCTELKLLLPEQIFDAYGLTKENVFYAAGQYIQIRSSTKEDSYLLGYYVNPDITDSGYNSWVALDHPYAIILDAAATVFKAIGKDEEAAAYRTLVGEQIQMLQTSNIVGNGF